MVGKCRREAMEGLARVHPAYGVILARAYADSDGDYAELIQRQMSWGQFAQRAAQHKQAARASLLEADGKIQHNLQNAHAYEMQQRQAFAAAMRQAAYQQQVISAMNRPVNTTCYRTGTF